MNLALQRRRSLRYVDHCPGEADVTTVPRLPTGVPFPSEDVELLDRLLARATPHQRGWLAGYLAGFDAAQGVRHEPVASSRPRTPLTILYASESGNAEQLAMRARKSAQRAGFDAKVIDMADADAGTLAKAKNLIVYASTWGEGDPPQRAADFYRLLLADDAPRIDGIPFAVLGLGDTAYVNFCATAKAIDARLEALGGKRAAARADLDLDFAKAAVAWTDATLKELTPGDQASARVVHVDFKSSGSADDIDADEPRYTSDNPLEAEIGTLVNLSGTGSSRETWHVELATEAADFRYDPGDAIGVVAKNDPELAGAVLAAVGLDGDAGLRDRLVERHDITTLSRSLVTAYASLTGRADVARLAEGDAFAGYAADRQLVDLLAEHPERLSAEQLTSLLRPLPGRLYSVASSLKATPGEAHLTIGAVRWASHGRRRNGVASTYLADRRKAGDRLAIYVKPNRHFRLPLDGSRPIIMIGAGTGIAPYRGFVAERAETGARGKSWLFFGERNYTTDFLYQTEWQAHAEAGALHRIDVAFSRDQPEKIYVQHRLWERRSEIRDWLADGAHIYVCGDEKGMGRDVDETLARILAEATSSDIETGRAGLKELARAGRYQRDVY
jgi:sulfite reductase (NADPH) flavoprotein alpha-component